MAEPKKTVLVAVENFSSRVLGSYAKDDVFGGVYEDTKAKKEVERLLEAGVVRKYDAKKDGGTTTDEEK